MKKILSIALVLVLALFCFAACGTETQEPDKNDDVMTKSEGVNTHAEYVAAKKGDKLVMTFEFTVNDEAEGLINFQLSNKGLVGYSWDLDAAEVAGAGSSLAVANEDELGDTGIYVIAALALVALIGTAIVIKKRA